MESIVKRSASKSRSNADVAKAATGVVAVGLLVCFFNTTCCLVASEYDMRLIAQTFSAPEWVYCLDWLGQSTIVVALCYLGLELGYLIADCLSQRGCVAAVSRPRAMTALQWISSIGVAVSFLLHLVVLFSCECESGRYPAAPDANLEDIFGYLIELVPFVLVTVCVACLLLRLPAGGRRLRAIRRANAALRPHGIARWVSLCVGACLAPILTCLAIFLVVRAVVAIIVLVCFIAAASLFICLMPFFLGIALRN